MGGGAVKDLRSRRAALKARFLRTSTLPERELLELLLSYAQPEDRLAPSAETLLARFGSLAGILDADSRELSDLKELSGSAVGLVTVAGALIRRSLHQSGGSVISSPQRAGEYLVPRLLGLNREMMYALCLDDRLSFLSCRAICEGDASRLRVDACGLLTEVLERNAAAVILAHNHPNGVALPSREDRVTTRRLAELLADFGVVLLDHLVVAGRDFVSLAAEEPLPPSPLRGMYG